MFKRRRSSGPPPMENEQQQTQAPPSCRAGCGFFGASATEGYCSQCFKNTLKRQQASPVVSPSSMAATTSALKAAVSAVESSSPSLEMCAKAAMASMNAATAKIECDEMVPTIGTMMEDVATTMASESTAPTTVDAPPPVKKANRCHMCKKRVGLTGFSCRCGGLYCGEHRYDKAHDCQFDYKTMEREAIRKNNPVVVSDKVQRI